ncbi:MAG: dephospho-CoA kinase [Candidatus Omnitrophica bacterium]|nr:dephospho-CoA kinase [Candidatus Omnitrophota bacterium]
MIIGLTGGFGTGKSYVAGIFKGLGAKVIDADRLAHDSIKKGGPAYRKVAALFGPSVLTAGREINKTKLGRIVFDDNDLLKRLDDIVHPEVIRQIKKKIRQTARGDVVVIDAPLLIEAGLVGMVDILVVVTCPKNKQIQRCTRKFGLDKEEVLQRIRNQIPLKKKIKMADHVVDNNGPKAETREIAKKIWRQIVWR